MFSATPIRALSPFTLWYILLFVQHTQVNPFPGEFRFPARRRYKRGPGHLSQTPLETACEELLQLGFPIPKEGMTATLFAKESVKTVTREYRVLYFVAFEEDNPVALQAPIARINARLRELRRQRNNMMQEGSYWDRSRAEKERLSPKLHKLFWMKIDDVLAQADPSVPFINAYQEEQFNHYVSWGGRSVLARASNFRDAAC